MKATLLPPPLTSTPTNLQGSSRAREFLDHGYSWSKNSRAQAHLPDGYMTGLTVGGLGKFMSFVRKSFPTGHQESVELPISNHEDEETGTFSKGGDSGSLIVDILGRFVALLTGGSNKGKYGSDITYATPFEWVWELVCKEFPGANLYFEDPVAFSANND